MEDDYEISRDNSEDQPKRRGVKRGTNRGKYRRSSYEKKLIVDAAATVDGDWRGVAISQHIPIGTAYGWIRATENEPKQHGGARNKKVTPVHVQKMIQYIENDPLISLSDIKTKLFQDEGLAVSTNTVHKYIDCQFYTVKKVRLEPSQMNSEDNKRKRANYVAKAMDYIGNGKTLIYIDETNCNLFLRRNFGRSFKGTRCSVKAPTSKGKNVHIVAGITQTGLTYWKKRRGSYKKEDCCEWFRCLLRQVTEPMTSTVIVCDNAPIHVSLENVLNEEAFQGATLLRLAPYSAPLNPIEECWSVVKSEIKKLLNVTRNEILEHTPPGITQTEHRLRHLEGIIDQSMDKITPNLCMKTCNHVQKHYQAVLSLRDLKMGDIPIIP